MCLGPRTAFDMRVKGLSCLKQLGSAAAIPGYFPKKVFNINKIVELYA